MSGTAFAARYALALVSLSAAAQHARTETFVEHSAEFRCKEYVTAWRL